MSEKHENNRDTWISRSSGKKEKVRKKGNAL